MILNNTGKVSSPNAYSRFMYSPMIPNNHSFNEEENEEETLYLFNSVAFRSTCNQNAFGEQGYFVANY